MSGLYISCEKDFHYFGFHWNFSVRWSKWCWKVVSIPTTKKQQFWVIWKMEKDQFQTKSIKHITRQTVPLCFHFTKAPFRNWSPTPWFTGLRSRSSRTLSWCVWCSACSTGSTMDSASWSERYPKPMPSTRCLFRTPWTFLSVWDRSAHCSLFRWAQRKSGSWSRASGQCGSDNVGRCAQITKAIYQYTVKCFKSSSKIRFWLWIFYIFPGISWTTRCSTNTPIWWELLGCMRLSWRWWSMY